MNTIVEQGDILKNFKKSEVGVKLYNTVQKQVLMSVMAPASALASIILGSGAQDKTKLSVLWVGDASALKPDGARWMGLTALLLENENLEMELNIVEDDRLGMETPWAKTAASLPDLDIIKISESSAESCIENYDLIILSHTEFIQKTDPIFALVTKAIQLNKKVYGLFWSDFDLLCEAVPAQLLNLKLGEAFYNPIQLESSKSGGDRIASVIAEINLADDTCINKEEIELFAHMRALSGCEGHSNQFNIPGDKVKGLKVPFIQGDHDFIHVIDNYIIDTKTNYLFRQSLDENSVSAVCQIHQDTINELMPNDDLIGKLKWGFKVKALNVFDKRILNLPEAALQAHYFEDCYSNNTGVEAARILGAQIIAHQGLNLDLNKLIGIYEEGYPEALMLYIKSGQDLQRESINDVEKLMTHAESLSNSGIAEATLFIAKNSKNDHEINELTRISAYQYHKNTMYIESINLIESGKISDGLDMMLMASVLGDTDARRDLPSIIEVLKKSSAKSDIPVHHLRNKNKYKNMSI